MLVYFTKMHGLGNDFMVIDRISHNVKLKPEQIEKLADRNFGVGFDQLLVVEAPANPKADFFYRIYNADGTEASQCGNGARAFSKFVYERGLTYNKKLNVETISGSIQTHIEDDGRISVNMGRPRLHPARVPFVADEEQLTYQLELNGQTLEMAVLSVGNPHAVMEVEQVDKAPVEEIGKALNQYNRFPQGVNVGFMQIINPSEVKMRVFERGVGETLACGTGACAAVISGFLRNKLNEQVKVHLPGGELDIKWQGRDTDIWMTGPAVTVYRGQLYL